MCTRYTCIYTIHTHLNTSKHRIYTLYTPLLNRYIGLIVTAQGFERDPDASANHGVAVAMGLVRVTESVSTPIPFTLSVLPKGVRCSRYMYTLRNGMK